MTYSQRDIVKVLEHTVPSGEVKTHPFIIISCDQAIKHETSRCYIGVMITHSSIIDKYSFSLKKEMIDGNLGDENSQARIHIIASFLESNISTEPDAYLGKMKKAHFEPLLKQIKDYTLKLDN